MPGRQLLSLILLLLVGSVALAGNPIKTTRADTAEFRSAPGAAREGSREVLGAQGIFNMRADNHHDLDRRARVMMVVAGGKWVLNE